ncbi:hypothetical protein FB567DRAFT_549589 [Paraphoma chrysanthemicola]|uniref:Uncharacterized protein n=1 Tax=Paraphoma chrysanthemicola TaxID=798071 RepID=A0A8K0R573_9PLEO|nr:hypothetical protein FB567DRAFT_549589 [Paraphoma chrysanthemicola]
MSHPQPTRLQFAALPIVFFAVLTTSALLKALPSSANPTKEKGLVVLGEAIGVFMVVLGIIMIGARMVSYDTEPLPRDGGNISKNAKATNRWDELAKSAGVVGGTETGAVFEHDHDDVVEDRDGRKEEKKIRKMLVRAFKPKKAALLGERKEVVVQVDES